MIQFCDITINHETMATEIITLSDLHDFRASLLEDFKTLLEKSTAKTSEPKEKDETIWLKSNQVQRLLGISPGTLQTLRVNGTIPYTKVGGVLFYDKKDILFIMEANKRNVQY